MVDAPPRPHARTLLEALASVATLEPPPRERYDDDARWILARSNAVSKEADVRGAQQVTFAGDAVVRARACIRGDLARVEISARHFMWPS